jgi:hypothetical protein
MVLIAGSVGAVLYLGFRFDLQTAGLAALVGMVLFQTVNNRLRDRSEFGDQMADLSRATADHAFRCLKVPAALLLNPSTSAQSEIHPADLADLLARSGIDLIAERIENESMVLDLLDYDVRFGQGFLFSPPRPVRAEALQTTAGDGAGAQTAADPSGVLAAVRAAS